jgi:hypothetical protein
MTGTLHTAETIPLRHGLAAVVITRDQICSICSGTDAVRPRYGSHLCNRCDVTCAAREDQP